MTPTEIKQHIDGLMQEFGFQTSMDFLNSTFGYAAKKPVLLLSVSLATIGTYLENFIGIDPFVYLAFIILLFLEFFTGMRASLKEGEKIQSKRFGRVILKLIIYTTLIGVINIFRTRLDTHVAFGFEINIYSLIYYAALNLIVVQLILSVFENLSRLGYEETNKIYKVIARILQKYIRLITPEEQREEEEKEEIKEERTLDEVD